MITNPNRERPKGTRKTRRESTTTTRRISPATRLVAAAIAALIGLPATLAACSAVDDHTSTVQVTQDGATATVDDMSVHLNPGGTHDGSLTIRATDLPELPADVLPAGAVAVGQALEVELSSGLAPDQTARVEFPAPTGVPATQRFVVVWQSGSAGRWNWLPTTWTAGDRMVAADTNHFSKGFLASIDVSQWAAERWKSFSQRIVGRANVDKPSCGSEVEARRYGVTVASSQGDSVKWCFGLDHGRQKLALSNNRITATAVTLPASWKVDLGPRSFSIAAAARAVGAAEANAYARPGYRAYIIDGGDTLEVTVPHGASGRVSAEFSVLSWYFSAIAFGLETYTAVARGSGDALAGTSAAVSSTFWGRLTGTSPSGPLDGEIRTCLAKVGDLSEGDSTAADFANVGKFAWDCVAGLVSGAMNVDTVVVFGKTILVQSILLLGSLILEGQTLLSSAVRELRDEIASFGGQEDPFYKINIFAAANDDSNALGWQVTPDGIGPIRLGMSIADAQRLGLTTQGPGIGWSMSNGSTCKWAGSPFLGAFAMFDKDNRLSMMWIRNTAINTPGGVGVGSSTEDVESLGAPEVMWEQTMVESDAGLISPRQNPVVRSGDNFLMFNMSSGRVLNMWVGTGVARIGNIGCHG